MDICKIPVGDNFICCPAFPNDCTAVWFEDAEGNEIEDGHYWDVQEWADDPSQIMGAIMGAMAALSQ